MRRNEPEVQARLDEAAGFLPLLPETCFGTLPTDGSLIIMKRGETGYWPTEGYATNSMFPTFDDVADLLNSQRGITKGQRRAMEIGSMAGFHVPGADPRNWNDDGTMKGE